MGIGSWAGLWFALGIPAILIMYLFKRKFIDTPVPSHLLWRRVLENTEANRPWQKLRSRLLMWLQLLAAAVLAFALMRPFLWAEAGSGGHLIVVADVSASMSARTGPGSGGKDPSGGETRLDEMKRRILEDTRQSDGGLTLIRMGAHPQVAASGTEDRGAWERAVEGLAPDYARTSYREAVSLASAVAEGQEDARIIVYTDGQWSEKTDGIPVSAPIEARRVGGTVYRNASVEQFGVDGGGRAVGVVANTGTEPLEAVVELSGDGRPQGSESLSLQPGERRTVTFDGAGAAEVYRLSLKGTPDDYAADDDAFAFPQSGGAVKALLLSDGNLFLEKALRLSGAEVTRLDLNGSVQGGGEGRSEGGLANGNSAVPPLPEARPDLVVVDGRLPDDLRSGEWGRLLNGAALWTIGGTDDPRQPADRRVTVSAHPVTRYLSLTEPYLGPLTEGRPAGLENIVTVGQRPAIAAGTENGRRTLWFGFNLQNGDLPLNSEFPVLVSNAVTWLTGGRGGGLGRAEAGAAVEVPIAAGAESAVWRPLQGTAFEAGDGAIPAETISDSAAAGSSPGEKSDSKNDPVPARPADNSPDLTGIPSSSQPAPNVPGLYAFEQAGTGLDDAPVYLLDVRPDASESAAPAEEGPAFGKGAENEAQAGGEAAPDRAAAGDSRGRLPLTLPLAALIAVIMLTEWGVYRRGRSI
ncbi:vWA domain-containing protein [Saccharibacillus alkalitolerans]|uniref:VWA domain-containing protein n=1 Tax=Saccharibacillus alkalitolerans TaxID=2705290 RepID=A0ABX0F6B9_9BACL|nr:BatA and WFA domain-containing protein [Saccharibacillus alkalitolerans]NGZ75995.1 VWA domain-containing protein [Saccharibacillus alkalitolerans]